MDDVQSVLVEYEDKTDEIVYANSGLLFAGGRYVLITANVIAPLLRKQKINHVRNLTPGRLLSPKTLLNVVPSLNVIVGRGDVTQYKRGVMVALFLSEELRQSCEKILREWTVDCQETDRQFKDALSLFFILELGTDDDAINFDDLTKCLCEFWAETKTFHVVVGRKVIIESTPFGNRNFLRSYSQGIISNILGKEDCLVLSDAPIAPGSEGAPIFMKHRCRARKKIPFGLVISSMSWWKGEWIGLTLGANLSVLIETLISVKVAVINDTVHLKIGNVLNVLDKSVVQVTSGTSWGTAVLLDKGKGVFVTNSHVIESNDGVALYWKATKIAASVVFKTNVDGGAYDLAILTANKRAFPQMESAIVSLDKLQTGERIFAAGFPLFARQLNPRPTLTSGHVSQVTSCMVKTTCSVLPGSSGGAILRRDGALVGVIVCNTRLQDERSPAYPRVNLAIPVSAFYGTISEFLQTKDASVLRNLQVDDQSVNKQWNLLSCKL